MAHVTSMPHAHVTSMPHSHALHMCRYSPIGIASIITAKMAEVEDFSVLVEEIGLYFTTVMLGLAIHGCIFLPLLYTVMTRSNPFKIIRAVLQALVTAFGTSSR